MDENMLIVPREDLERLEQRDYLLQCLESYGVDNWEGFDDAMNNFRSWMKENYPDFY